jgi:hypothetical protein
MSMQNVEAMALELDGPGRAQSPAVRGDYQWMIGAAATLGTLQSLSEQGVWSIDASEFPKKGKASVGVAPQYCGALGKTANCQSGVFICYSSPKGHALLDSRLYLPKCWFAPAWAERRQQCRIPEEVSFQTKPELAVALLRPLLERKLFGGHWMTCDCSFGNNESFRQLPQGLLLSGGGCLHRSGSKKRPGTEAEQKAAVESLVQTKKLLNWQTHKVAEGEKGPNRSGLLRGNAFI